MTKSLISQNKKYNLSVNKTDEINFESENIDRLGLWRHCLF